MEAVQKFSVVVALIAIINKPLELGILNLVWSWIMNMLAHIA
jgi:hypothetical protein